MGFSSNPHPALSFCLSMIFFGKPVPTFSDHALVRDALDLADRVGLTPNGEQRWRLGEIDRGDHALHRGGDAHRIARAVGCGGGRLVLAVWPLGAVSRL